MGLLLLSQTPQFFSLAASYSSCTSSSSSSSSSLSCSYSSLTVSLCYHAILTLLDLTLRPTHASQYCSFPPLYSNPSVGQQQSDPSWSICHIPRPRVSLRHTHTLSSVPSLWPEMFATISSLYYAPSHFFCFYHLNSDDNSLWGDSQNPCVVRSRPKSNSYGFDNQPIIKIFEMTSKKICTILKICALPTHLQQSSICYRYELCLPKYVFFLFFSLCLIFL